MASRDIYHIPREQVDVEGLANELARYLKLNAIDAQALSEHPQSPSFWPTDTVGAGLSPELYNEYLAQVNAAIERLSPPSSLKDRVLRMHLVVPATAVFTQYKFLALLKDHPNLLDQVLVRHRAIFTDFMEHEFPVLFPGTRNRTAHNPATPTILANAPNPPSLPAPAHQSGTPKALTDSEVAGYLDRPKTLLGKQFLHAPPSGEEQEYKGLWAAESYSVRMEDGHVDDEFLVRLEAFGEDSRCPWAGTIWSSF